ncbi:MAG: AAA family ATPase [Pseudomonadota bacterium]
MPEQVISPNVDAITSHLRHITRRWGEVNDDLVLELRFLTAEDRAVVKNVARFKMDEQGTDEAAQHAAAMNQHKLNAYVVVNPIKASAHIEPGKAAKDDDIAASFFHWADADDGQAAQNIKDFVGPRPTFVVLTGTQPCNRPHVYWELEEPTQNLDAWRKTQEAIAATLQTDASVVNPSRIMRIGGTINWPKPQKREKGYATEICDIHIHNEDDRPRVASERMSRAFEGAAPASTSGIQIATSEAPAPLDREREAIKAVSGSEWNNAVLRLVGSYVRKGLSDAEIHALTDPLTLPGYSIDETRTEVQDIIDRTRANPKFDVATQPVFCPSPEAVETNETGIITGLRIQSSADFLSDLTPAVYVVDGVLAERRCLSLTGYAGHGKTTLALHLAIQVAMGGDFGGAECEQGSVLVLAGENPDNVKWQYAAALAAVNAPQDLPINFLPGHFQLSSYLDDLIAKADRIPNLRLVIIDSLQAFFEGDNDNGNVEMMEAARRFRKLSEIKDGPTVVVIAHPAGKKPDKDNIIPRGGSAFGNEFDGNLTVWAEPDGTQLFHHTEKFRGAPFEPMTFVMNEREFDHLKDHKGRPLRLKVSRQQMLIEAVNAAHKAESRDREAIAAIEANPQITQRSLAETLGVSKSTADRIMQGLKDEKLIKRRAKKWELTSDGKEFFNGE